jgi:hypothetical protein
MRPFHDPSSLAPGQRRAVVANILAAGVLQSSPRHVTLVAYEPVFLCSLQALPSGESKMGMNYLMYTMGLTYGAIFIVIGTWYLLLVPYIILRVRERGAEIHDPQLGIKAGLHCLITITLLIFLAGCSVVVVDKLMQATRDENVKKKKDVMWPDEYDEFGYDEELGLGDAKDADDEFLSPATRVGFALMVSGGLTTALFAWLLISRTNERKWPAPRRTYSGGRFVLASLISILAITGALVIAFGKEDSVDVEDKAEVISLFLGLVIVWVPAGCLELALFGWSSRLPRYPGKYNECLDCAADLTQAVIDGNHSCKVCHCEIPGFQARRLLRKANLDVENFDTEPPTAESVEKGPGAPPDPQGPIGG